LTVLSCPSGEGTPKGGFALPKEASSEFGPLTLRVTKGVEGKFVFLLGPLTLRVTKGVEGQKRRGRSPVPSGKRKFFPSTPKGSKLSFAVLLRQDPSGKAKLLQRRKGTRGLPKERGRCVKSRREGVQRNPVGKGRRVGETGNYYKRRAVNKRPHNMEVASHSRLLCVKCYWFKKINSI
jgi:hypothetical protein